MLRLRFEDRSQLFENDAKVIILPLSQIDKETAGEYKKRLFAEIPSVVWEKDTDTVKEQLKRLKSFGIYDVVAENIGAVNMASELGMNIHGGMTLNILNSTALHEYYELGLCDATLSFELAFSKMRRIKHEIPIGFVGYGYLPLMKFRACPSKAAGGCASCDGRPVLTDRMDERFQMICHGKKYSELLNCVPLYVADKTVPDVDFQTLYFTVEDKASAEKIYNMYKGFEPADFRRTAGLYFRELQ